MKKTTRAWLAVFAGIVALFILAVLLLILFFPTERARDLVITRIEQATGRSVSIGPVSLKFFPRVRASLSDLDFGGTAVPGAPRISAETVSLGVKLLPLLARRLEVSEIVVERPEVEIVMVPPPAEETATSSGRPSGSEASRPQVPGRSPGEGAPRAGGERAGAPPGETPPPESSAQPGLDIRAERIALRDGRLLVRFPDGEPFLEISGLDESLSVEATAEGDLRLSGRTLLPSTRLHLPTGIFGEGLELRLEKTLSFDASEDLLEVEQASLHVADLPIELKGSVRGVKTRAFIADLTLQGGPGEVASILGLVPSGLVPEMEGMTSSGTLAMRASVTGPLAAPSGPNFDLSLDLADGRVRYPGVQRDIEGIRLALRATPERVRVDEFDAHSSESRIHAVATVTDYRLSPKVTADLDADVNLDEVAFFYPAAGSLGLGGRARIDLHAEGDMSTPEALAASGTIRASDLRAHPPGMTKPIEGVSGLIRFDRNEAALEGVTARVGSGDVALDGKLSNPLALDPATKSDVRAEATLSVRSRRLDLDELMVPKPKDASAESQRAPGSRAGRVSRTAGIPPLPPLDGVVSFQGDEVRIRGVSAKDMRARLALDRGVVTLEKVTANAFGGNVALDGVMDLREPAAPAFQIGADIRNARAEEFFAATPNLSRFGGLTGFLNGGINTRAQMSGALDDTLALNLAALAADGDLDIRDAKLVGHPIQSRLAGFLQTPALQQLAVSEWRQAFRIANGRLEVEGLNLRASKIEVQANGWQSLDGRVEMAFDLWLPPEYVRAVRGMVPKQVGELAFGGDADRFLVPVLLTGPSRDPKVTLDTDRLSSVAAARAQKLLEEQKTRLGETVRGEAEEALRGLLGKDKADSADTVKDTKKKIEDRLKKLFK